MQNKFHETKYKNTFTIALYQDDGKWVAHNLDLDLIATDKDKMAALNELKVLTFGHIDFCLSNDMLHALNKPAPARFWQMVSEKTTAEVIGHITSKESIKDIVDNSAIHEIESGRDAEARQPA